MSGTTTSGRSSTCPAPRCSAAATAGRDGLAGRDASSAAGTALVVASSRFAFAGTEVANAPQLLPEAGLKLWRLDGVRGSRCASTGKQNGDLYGGSTGRVTVYGCGGGSLRAILLIKQPQQVEIRRNGTTWRILDFKREQVWDGRIPAPPGSADKECAFDFSRKG